MANLIVQFLNGNGDNTIRVGSGRIQKKLGGEANCPIIDIPFADRDDPPAIPALGEALAQLDNQSRIYLRGHGNWQMTLLGGWPPRQVSALLKRNGLTNVRVISITGCNAARAPQCGKPKSVNQMEYPEQVQEQQLIMNFAPASFAGEFHADLARGHAPILATPVTGRTYPVDVQSDGTKHVVVGAFGGMKSGILGAKWSKIVFRWSGSAQKCEWVIKTAGDYEHY